MGIEFYYWAEPGRTGQNRAGAGLNPAEALKYLYERRSKPISTTSWGSMDKGDRQEAAPQFERIRGGSTSSPRFPARHTKPGTPIVCRCKARVCECDRSGASRALPDRIQPRRF